MKLARYITLTGLAFSLAACSMVPDYERPVTNMPVTWSSTGAEAAATSTIDKEWWKKFGNPELATLMETALSNNLDIEAALARVEQARGAARAAGAPLLPQLSGSGGASGRSADGSSMTDTSQVGLSASYAIDIWGRYRAQAEAANLSLTATEYDRQATTLIVQSQVATTYFTTLALKDRIAISEQSLTAAKDTLRIVEARYKAGSISGLDLAQQRNAVATIEAGLPSLRAQLAANENALAILLARTPGQFATNMAGMDSVELPEVSPLQPSALLERRPDIRSAETRLMSANANIGAARAAFFPSLDISAGLTRNLTGNAIDTVTTLGASVLAPIFSGGSLEGNLQSAQGRQAELAASYRQTVLTSFSEVEDALTNMEANAQRAAFLSTAATESGRAYELSEARYRTGASDLLSVLDAQRNWLSARDNAAQAKLNQYNSAVELFVALGGGWEG